MQATMDAYLDNTKVIASPLASVRRSSPDVPLNGVVSDLLRSSSRYPLAGCQPTGESLFEFLRGCGRRRCCSRCQRRALRSCFALLLAKLSVLQMPYLRSRSLRSAPRTASRLFINSWDRQNCHCRDYALRQTCRYGDLVERRRKEARQDFGSCPP